MFVVGIGFNVVYQLTDCPILLSDHKDICMFDPHLKYVPGACDERPGGHVDLRQDGTFAKLFPDFMAGFLSKICYVFLFYVSALWVSLGLSSTKYMLVLGPRARTLPLGPGHFTTRFWG